MKGECELALGGQGHLLTNSLKKVNIEVSSIVLLEVDIV